MNKTTDAVGYGALDASIFLKIIEFGLNRPDGFTYEEIMEELRLDGWEKDITGEYLRCAFKNAYYMRNVGESANIETPFFVVKLRGSHFESGDAKYIISFDAHFKYIDYQELKFARENAEHAKTFSLRAIKLSCIAIVISLISMFVPFIIALFMNQVVKIDEGQFQLLKSMTEQPVTNGSEASE